VATKLFLRNTQTHGLTPAGDATWYDMLTTAGSSADTAVVNTTASGTEIQFTKTAGGSTIAWISGRVPSGGFTLTATDVDAWLHESNGQANIGGRYRVFKRTGAGVITELAGGPFNDGAEPGTSAASMTWVGNVTDTAFAEDDRILVRFYITNVGTMGGNRTATLTFNAANAATGDSFFNINETVAFKAESNPQTVTPAVGDATIAGLAPTVSTPTLVTAGLGAATIAGLAPTVATTANVQATTALGAVAAAGLAPTVTATAHVTVSPAVGAGVIAGLTPTVTATAHVWALPGVGAATLAGLEPQVSATAHVWPAPGTGAATVEGLAPIVEGGAGVTMRPDTGDLVAAGLEPAVLTPVVVIVPVGSGAWLGLAPLVLTPVEVATALGTVVAAGYAPTVEIGAVFEEVPGAGAGEDLELGAEALVEPGVGTAMIRGLRPTVTGSPELVSGGMGGGSMSGADIVDRILGDSRRRRRWYW
jgi:hypothetical protein